MLKAINTHGMSVAPEKYWGNDFFTDFGRRYMHLLSGEFRTFDPTLAYTVLDAAMASLYSSQSLKVSQVTYEEIHFFFSSRDLKRLESYSRNLVDYHMIMDLLPALAVLYFGGKFGETASLPKVQAGLLLGLGLQRHNIDHMAKHFDVAVNQAMALFNKAVRKLSLAMAAIVETHIEGAMDADAASKKRKLELLESESALAKSAPPAKRPGAERPSDRDEDFALPKAARDSLMKDPDLAQYAVPQDDGRWDQAMKGRDVSEDTKSLMVAVKRDAQPGSAAKATKRDSHHNKKSGGYKETELYDPRNRLGGNKKH
jgi:N-acetyltransferase 10